MCVDRLARGGVVLTRRGQLLRRRPANPAPVVGEGGGSHGGGAYGERPGRGPARGAGLPRSQATSCPPGVRGRHGADHHGTPGGAHRRRYGWRSGTGSTPHSPWPGIGPPPRVRHTGTSWNGTGRPISAAAASVAAAAIHHPVAAARREAIRSVTRAAGMSVPTSTTSTSSSSLPQSRVGGTTRPARRLRAEAQGAHGEQVAVAGATDECDPSRLRAASGAQPRGRGGQRARDVPTDPHRPARITGVDGDADQPRGRGDRGARGHPHRAERGVAGGHAPDAPRLAQRRDLGVDLRVAGGDVDHPGRVQVGGGEGPGDDDDVTRSPVTRSALDDGRHLRRDGRGHHPHGRPGLEERLRPAGRHRTGADEQHLAAGQPHGERESVQCRRRRGSGECGCHRWIPHSVLDEPAQRPERGSAPGSTRLVQGSQPIDG